MKRLLRILLFHIETLRMILSGEWRLMTAHERHVATNSGLFPYTGHRIKPERGLIETNCQLYARYEKKIEKLYRPSAEGKKILLNHLAAGQVRLQRLNFDYEGG